MYGGLYMNGEQRFYSALKDVFVGEHLEGKSGYVNLMNMKSQYFSCIKPFIEKKISEKVTNPDTKNEIFDKIYTFFDSYFNETGTPFFYKTQIHKNIYEKVYSDREDVSLFWKTQKLYYVKSEANYKTIENMSVTSNDGLTRYFNFDASEIEHQKNNEKKTLSFHLYNVSDDKGTFSFKVRYAKNCDYDRIKEYLKIDDNNKIKKYILDNFDNLKHPQIKKNESNLNKGTISKDDVYIRNLDDTINSVLIELSINKTDNILRYFIDNSIICPEDILKKAFYLYKRQNEIDYFIHKDAEGFLKEQFDIYVYQYIFGDKNIASDLTQERINEIKIIKEIAYLVIEYIAKFENELKAIWEKPKFVRNSNYVLTLDRISNNIELIKKIISHENFEKQVAEWENLSKQWLREDGKELKKKWCEFNFAVNMDKTEIIKNNQLNDKYKYLPIDTKYFEDLKYEILDNFEDLSKSLSGTLVKSDNWQALNTLKDKYHAQIQTIYIDPPFNTGRDFDFKDGYQDSTWLTLMDNRLYLAKNDYLNNNGCIYLHLDGNANYLGRILLNNNFLKNNFVNEIIWSYRTGGASTKTSLPKKHDNIYLYSNKPNSFEIKSLYERQYYEKAFMDVQQDEEGRYYADTLVRDVLEGTIIRAENNAVISSYNVKPVLNTSLERWGFDNQKPEGLLDILTDIVNSKDYVLDFFAGSGSTLAAAHKKNLKWLGFEMGDHYYNVIIPRLKKILIGDTAGISEKYNWQGGGFFKYYELEQYEETLQKCLYTDKNIDLNNVEKYTFNPDSEKLLSALELDIENKNAKLDLNKLYPDIDLAETLSNATGKFIKKLSKEKVIFEDDTEIDLTDMSWDNMKVLKPLLWWKN